RVASRARSRLEAGIDAVPLGVLLLDERLCVIGVNAQLRSMGLAADHPERLPVPEAVPGAVGVQLERLAQHVLDTGVPQLERFAADSGPGAGHWRVRAHRVAESVAAVSGIGITIEDVTELERTLEELRVSQQRWQAVLGSDRIAVCLRDHDARVIICNAAYAALYGRGSPEDLVGTDFHELMEPADAEPAAERYRERWESAGQAELNFDREYTLQDGRHVVLHAMMSVVRDSAGVPLYQLALLENRTEERRLADELARTRRIEAIGRLAGGVAHDVNNMLAVIIGYAEIVAGRLGPDHQLQPELTEIRRAAEHSRSLARDLLAVGRRQVLEREPVVPSAIIAGLSTLLRRTVGEAVTLVIEDESEGAVVLGDRAQLETVIVNLVANARDAMPSGGRLTVRSGLAPASNEAPHGSVTIAVADTGSGMSEQVRESIFEPFFTTKELGQGTGLGLATVMGIVEQMGGQVAVESEPGRGTTFTISLPRDPQGRPPEPEVEQQAAEAGLDASRRTVLVVEDEPQVRGLVERLVTSAGYMVLCAPTGTEALALLRDPARTIDLLLTDMILPDLSGGELARTALELRPGLRVVYTSGYTGETAVRDGLPEGDGFLAKPYGRAELARTLEAAFA
ncbi:MAG: ATP-binding protein, partial [Solirubrobacteraceae bacterium]